MDVTVGATVRVSCTAGVPGVPDGVAVVEPVAVGVCVPGVGVGVGVRGV
jgi:hypothetical protein